MSLSLPTPPEKRFEGSPSGTLKLFFAGLVFLCVLLLGAVAGVIRRGRRNIA